jgi:hypothetical protein
MHEIWKYNLPIEYEFEIEMPDPIFPLTIQRQGMGFFLWAIVNPDAPKLKKKFFCVGMGHPFEIKNKTYIGTVQGNSFVWHYFMVHNY